MHFKQEDPVSTQKPIDTQELRINLANKKGLQLMQNAVLAQENLCPLQRLAKIEGTATNYGQCIQFLQVENNIHWYIVYLMSQNTCKNMTEWKEPYNWYSLNK